MGSAIKNIYMLTVVLLFLASCENNVNIKVDSFDDKILVNAALTPDSTIRIYISKTSNPFNPNSNTTSFVPVLSTKAGKKINLKDNGNGYFTSDLKPTVNEQLRLTIEASNLPQISTYTMIPGPPSVVSVQETMLISSLSLNKKITVTVDDPAESEDYYIVEVRELTQAPTTIVNLPLYSEDKSVANTSAGISEPQLLLSDESFNGQQKSILFTFNRISLNSSHQLVIKRCTKDFWQYKKTYYQYKQSAGQATVQPIQMYSNIESGAGIFGSYSSAVINFDF